MEIATQALLAELRRAHVPYARVDTADPKDELGNRGEWTVHNIELALRHLVDAVRKVSKPDVHVVYIPIAQEFPALFRDLAFIGIGLLFRKPVVVHLHGGAFADFYGSRRPLTQRALRAVIGRAAVGIVLTEQLRPSLECVIPVERVTVVPNGIDLPDGGSVNERQTTSVTVLFLSSLFRSKGIFVFIEAFARAREAQQTLRGIVAGAWPSADVEEEAVALARRLSLDESLRFVGPAKGGEKTRLLFGADIFCLPSFFPLEGQPLVVIEAMAAGLPVVATAWRGITDTVVDGETGLLVEEAAPALVAERLAYLAENADERRRMGAAGRRRYEQLYTQRAFGERMIEVLRPLLDGAVR